MDQANLKRSDLLWETIQREHAADMFALQEQAVEHAMVLAARLAHATWPGTGAIVSQMRADRVHTTVEYDDQPPPEIALDIEWMLRKVCPCLATGAVRLLQVRGDIRRRVVDILAEDPAPADDDLSNLQYEFLRTDEKVLNDVLLNPGPLFSDALLTCAVREASKRAIAGPDHTSLLLVQHILTGRMLLREAPGFAAFILHLRLAAEEGVEVVSVDRVAMPGMPEPVTGSPDETALVDVANNAMGNGLAIRIYFDRNPSATRQWTIMAGLGAFIYPEP